MCFTSWLVLDLYSIYEIVQRFVAQILWKNNIFLMDKLIDKNSRIWYVQKIIKNDWGKTMLNM